MSVFDRTAIEHAFSLFNSGTILEEPLELKGDVDINYKIVADTGLYVLKYVVNTNALEQFEFFGSLHSYLREHNVCVPLFQRSRTTGYVCENFVLMEFMNGEIVKDWNTSQIISLTEHFAEMLLVLQRYRVPDFVKNKDDKYIRGSNLEYCHDVYKPKILQLEHPDNIVQEIVAVIDLLYGIRDDFNSLPKQIIHGDLNEKNALFIGNENTAIIDFGLSYNPLVYDLGEYLYWYSMPWWSHKFNSERYDVIVKTFTQKIPLSSIELRLLPCMLLRRGMMDLMLTLEWYWSQPLGTAVPSNRLRELTDRNAVLIAELL
jgi:Ser/Thr protein kinase RdoA (MazF antagonist)